MSPRPGCKAPILVQTFTVDTSGSASYTLQLPPNTTDGYFLTFSAANYVTESTPPPPLTVADGVTTTAPTITLSAPPPSTTTTT